jgi:DNA-binding NarL/FixJ family response regulator
MSRQRRMIRVVVADDQALVREGFVAILESQTDIEVVAAVADGTEAVAAARSLDPDLVLIDIRMPEMDGIEATRCLSDGERPRVLVLTTFDLDEYVYEALRAGASGFLLKDAPRQQLIEAVRIVAAGEALLAPQITRRLIEQFLHHPPLPVRGAEPLPSLTSREHEVLRLIAHGMSNSEIAEALFVTEATVKSHVAHVLTKLGVRDRVQAVVLAYETGLVRPGEHTTT